MFRMSLPNKFGLVGPQTRSKPKNRSQMQSEIHVESEWIIWYTHCILSSRCVSLYRHNLEILNTNLTWRYCFPCLNGNIWTGILEPDLLTPLQMCSCAFDAKGPETNVHSFPKPKNVPTDKPDDSTGKSSFTKNKQTNKKIKQTKTQQVDPSMSVCHFSCWQLSARRQDLIAV